MTYDARYTAALKLAQQLPDQAAALMVRQSDRITELEAKLAGVEADYDEHMENCC